MKSLFALAALLALASVAHAAKCVDLIAGQNIDSGDVCVEIVDGKLEVELTTHDGWQVKEWHIYVGDAEAELPWKNSPAPGKFDWAGTAEELTLTLTPEQIGIASWSDGEKLLIAAHAVVCKGEQEETAWGEGHSIGKNWSMGFCVNVCEEEYFNVDAFNDSVLSTDAKVVVQYQGGNSTKPYFLASINGGAPVDTYCVDLSNTIRSNVEYCAITASSYDVAVDGLPGINNPQNLPLANYILNTYPIGTVMSDGNVLTSGSIQRAMWTLIWGGARSAGEGPWSQAHLDELLAAAVVDGQGYVPPCTGVVAVIVYPVRCDTDDQSGQALIAQALISEFPLACDTTYKICE
jgi:hypothetical protein